MVNYCGGISRDEPHDHYRDRERIMEHYGEPFASDIMGTARQSSPELERGGRLSERRLTQITTGVWPMRRSLSIFILASVFSLTAAGSILSASAVEAIQDNYCLQGRTWGYPGNCQFSTYEQCMASASGTDASCGINPLKGAPQKQQRRGSQRRQ
jgi:hypothetical protein